MDDISTGHWGRDSIFTCLMGNSDHKPSGKPHVMRHKPGDLISCSSFSTPEGAEEFFFVIRSGEPEAFEKGLAALAENYLSALKMMGLTPGSIAFSRIFLSDRENQKDLLFASAFYNLVSQGAVSIIQQNPMSSDKIVAFAYHVRVREKQGNFAKEISSIHKGEFRNAIGIKGRHYRMVWIANCTGVGASDARRQTERLFRLYSDFSSQFGITLQNNLVRTWIYVHDIDNNYNAMVEARKEFFDRHGLTAATRYVASTGIQGKAAEDGALVALDSLSFGNIREEQIETMNALDRLSPTILYGVTFERGLRVKFGDRSHLYISGTASIDKEGNILHGDDVGKQAGRTLENVEALLKNQGATFEDLAYALVYIRNPEHRKCVQDILDARLPKHVPLLLVEAAVCRPGWLFEMEGVGIIPDNNPYPPFL